MNTVFLKNLLLAAGAMSLAVAGYAGEEQAQKESSKVGLEEIRDRCLQVVNHNQMKRQYVKIKCDVYKYKWLKCPAQQEAMDRSVHGATIGFKNLESKIVTKLDHERSYDCFTFVQEKLYHPQVPVEMECQKFLDIIQLPSDLDIYCQNKVEQRIKQDEEALISQGLTGQTWNTCQGATTQQQELNLADCQEQFKAGKIEQQGQVQQN